VLQLLVGDVGVDFGNLDAGVAEQDLDASQVRSPLQQVGGKGVAEGVGGYSFADARPLLGFLDRGANVVIGLFSLGVGEDEALVLTLGTEGLV